MNTKLTKKSLVWTSALLVAVLLTMAFPQLAIADDNDPPGRVARIRYLQGSVSFQPAGESDWTAAVTNRPMTTGDHLWADADSRAEVQIGSAMIRLDANTGFSFLNLDDRTVQIQLTEGNLNLQVRRLGRDEVFEVDTPNQAFTVTRPGRYRVQAGTDGASSMVIVRQGQGEVTGGGRTYNVYSGQSGTFTGTDSLDGYVVAAGNPDDFDNWGQSRDRQYEGSRSARYVSPDVVGYEDLDNNGSWRSDPTYGNVWIPTSVQSGWAPYHNGHWVWIAPWGWTWVDDAPWGYAPFHYGRWVSLRGNWGWVPGPMNYRPVYAPALVAFIGGPGFGVAISLGGGGGYGGGDVGWFPLGPREAYVPGYNTSRGYFNRVNTSNTNISNTTITNIYNNQVTNNTTNITNVRYVNRTVPGAVTAVPQNAFRSSEPVARAAVPVNARQIASAPVISRAAVVPTRDSVFGRSTANRVAQPSAAVANRPVVAKAKPPAPPVPFAKQQQELAKHPGQPLAVHEVQTLRPANVATAHPLVKQAPPGKLTTPIAKPAPPAAANTGRPANAQPVGPPVNKTGTTANAPANNPPPARTDRPPSAQSNQPPSGNRPGTVNAPHQVNSQPVYAPPPADKPGTVNAPHQINPQPVYAPPPADKPGTVNAPHQINSQPVYAPPPADKPGTVNAPHQINSQPVYAPPPANKPGTVNAPHQINSQPVYAPPPANKPGTVNAPHQINPQPVYAPPPADKPTNAPPPMANRPANQGQPARADRPPSAQPKNPPPIASPEASRQVTAPENRPVAAPHGNQPPAPANQSASAPGAPTPHPVQAGPPPSPRPQQQPKAQSAQPLTPAQVQAEKAREEQKKRESTPPPN